MNKVPIVLIIMDGYGLGESGSENAIHEARTPNLDGFFEKYPHTTLIASGEEVGLPAGQIGNSEVGHTNIGAGRVVYQDLTRITKAVRDGVFFENEAYAAAMTACKRDNKSLHLIGLLSDGGVHSTLEHLYALIKMAKQHGLEKVYIHAFLDGRDVGPKTGSGYIFGCIKKCIELKLGEIVTVMGRFYAMDRDKRWDRIETAYKALTGGKGRSRVNPVKAVEHSYTLGITDEFVEPVICNRRGLISEGDSVIFFNFRPDRARELTMALTDPDFKEFERPGGFLNLNFVCTTQYDEEFKTLPVAFPPDMPAGTLGEYLGKLGLRQLRIAETEKYAHVTFFFNGGVEKLFPGEDRVLIPSPREVATYDMKPEMSAAEVTAECVERIRSGEYDVVVCNLANCDMVGHTGDFNAAVRAVETVDECVGRIVRAVSEMGGVAFVTADHGNAEKMYDELGEAHTAHTTNPVPLIVIGADVSLRPGRLADIAPTMLDIMGLCVPPEMTGESLIAD